MDQQHPLAMQFLTAAVVVLAVAMACLVATGIGIGRQIRQLRRDTARLSQESLLFMDELRTLSAATKPHLDNARVDLQTIAHRSTNAAHTLQSFGADAAVRIKQQQAALAGLTAPIKRWSGPLFRVGRVLVKLRRAGLLF